MTINIRLIAWLLIFLSSLLFLVLHAIQEREEKSGVADNGMALYQTNCVACHGPAGLGDGPTAASLPEKPANIVQGRTSIFELDFLAYKVVINGKIENGMPAFKNTLDENDVRDIFAYLRSL